MELYENAMPGSYDAYGDAYASATHQHQQEGGARRRARGKKAPGEVSYYTVVETSHGDLGGCYRSKSGPAAAAKKAASKRFTSGVSSITLAIRLKGTDIVYRYQAKRVKLSKPVVQEYSNGKQVERKYVIDVHAA